MAAASRKATRKPSPARRSTAKAGAKPKAKVKAKVVKSKTKAAPATARGKTAKPKAKAKTKAKVKVKAKIRVKAKARPKAKAKPKAKARPKAAGKAKSAAAKTPSNRRRFDRRDTRIAARLEHAGGVTEGTVTNLSLEGCLFAPRIDLKPNSRIKLYLASETKPVAATVKAVSELGVHCLMHAGGVTLGRLSTDLDDMALLMLSAGRPHVVTPKAE